MNIKKCLASLVVLGAVLTGCSSNQLIAPIVPKVTKNIGGWNSQRVAIDLAEKVLSDNGYDIDEFYVKKYWRTDDHAIRYMG